MKYLLSTYSVNPYKGSEDYIGWNWVLQLSKNMKKSDELYVITKKFNEKDVIRGLKEFNIDNVNLIIVDVPKYLDWFKHKYSVFHHMYYILWQHQAYKWVKKSKIKFDVIHHVTMNDYRITGEMYKVKDAYTIFGPVGGAQITPKSLKKYEKNKLASKFREIINCSRNYNIFYKNALRKFDKIYAINNETRIVVEKITHKQCELLPELCLKEEFKNLNILEKNNDKIKIIFVGRLISKKGIYLLLDVLKNISLNIQWELSVYGSGKDEKEFKKIIDKYNLNDKIVLYGKKKFAEISDAYRNADIFVFPSLRETSGNVLLEAMAHSLPIVALNTSFANIISGSKCGIFINVKQPRKSVIDDCKIAIEYLCLNKEKRDEYGNNGYKYVNMNFNWEDKYNKIYGNINSKKQIGGK